MQSQPVFYVYHHTRPDTGQVFYVGKGKGRRAFGIGSGRSEFWRRVVAKSGGVEVDIVARGLTEHEAFHLERKNISALRRAGVRLCNLTDGGEGAAGARRSESWKRKMSAAHKGKEVPQEVRDKISASVKASGFVHTPEMRAKIAETHTGNQYSLGRKHTDEWMQRQREWTAGNKSRTGQAQSAEEREKKSIALKGVSQKKVECPHCGQVGGNAMKRWHFDNCKKIEA